MIKQACFFLLTASLLTACTINQTFHSFPKEAGRMLVNETCNCDTITFIEAIGATTIFDQGPMPRIKTKGYMTLEDGTQKPYSFIKGALYIDEDWNPLNFSGSVGIVTNFITGITLGSSRTHRIFNGVKQTAELFNPFDGKTYFLFATFNGESISLVISLSPKTSSKDIGYLNYAYAAKIYGINYKMKVVREWQSVSEKTQENGKTLWHQYPGGAYIIISDDKGDEIKIFQGAASGKYLGMDAFTDYKSTVLIPKGISHDIKRDMFLFFYASEFSENFVDDIQRLPGCLNYPEEQGAGECDLNMVLQ